MAYIIGTYNKYDTWDREHSRYVFEINNNWYAIKEVQLEWGVPQLPVKVDRNECAHEYYIYDTYEDAMRFVRQIKMVNAR